MSLAEFVVGIVSFDRATFDSMLEMFHLGWRQTHTVPMRPERCQPPVRAHDKCHLTRIAVQKPSEVRPSEVCRVLSIHLDDEGSWTESVCERVRCSTCLGGVLDHNPTPALVRGHLQPCSKFDRVRSMQSANDHHMHH